MITKKGGKTVEYTEFVSESESDTENFAKEFAKKLKHGDIVAFFGDLGAGKTAFTRGAVSVLCPGAFVCSPTYAVMNEYKGEAFTVCHFDLYRIHGEDDLVSVGFDDAADGKNIVFTEWSENVKEFLPKKRYDVTIEKLGEEKRLIKVAHIE